MNKKVFFLTLISAGVATYLYRTSRQLKLIYNHESGQLIIDHKRQVRCCNKIYIENLIVYLNGEVFTGHDYFEKEKVFDSAIFVDIPDMEEGDLIEVKMKTHCSRQFRKWGRLDIV